MIFYTVANLSKARRCQYWSFHRFISLMNSQVHDLRKRNQSALRLSVDASTDEQSQLMCGNISYVFLPQKCLMRNDRKLHWGVPRDSKLELCSVMRLIVLRCGVVVWSPFVRAMQK